MRNAFAQELTELARLDERIVLLSGDIGNRLFDTYKARYPRRFYNCGVAEANMIGVAAGLAMSGLRPVCYTIASFITYRCMEQIRVDLCYHRAKVIVVGTGSGLSYASLGATHYSCEDMGMMRLLPGMTVVAPADAMETKAVLRVAIDHPGPVYIRIGKKGEATIYEEAPSVTLGKAIRLKGGVDACLVCAGAITSVGLEAAELLSRFGYEIEVISCHTIKPLDQDLLKDVFARFNLVATLEEHSILGGLGGSVAEWMASHPNFRSRLIRFGSRDELPHRTMNQEQARAYFNLTAEGITKQISRFLDEAAVSNQKS